MSDAPTFDRDATKEALPVVAQALMNGGVQGCDEFAAGAAVLDAARWAVEVTEGDGRVVEIVTECEHGKTDPHHWDPSTTISDEGWCPGGSRRVLEPGEYVLVKKVGGRWPMTNRVFNAIEDALVRETGSASMRTIETVVETYLDALAGGEQP